MTQGRDGISLAHARALKLTAVARRLSLVAVAFVIAALVVGTAGTSYAKSKKKIKNTPPSRRLEDTVVVSSYGAVFDGSLETFVAGAGHSSKPKYFVHGPATNLGASTGAAFDSVSSMDAHIAVSMPIDFFDLDSVLCGPFGQPAPGTVAPLLYGTGLVEIFSDGANGNSAPENIICSPLFAYGYPNTTGIFFPQGVAFESPYDGINPPGHDELAVANMFPEVYGSPDCPGDDCGLAACAPAPTNIEPSPGHPGVCGGGPVGPGASLGTITEYDRSTLVPGLNNIPPSFPFGGWVVDAINPLTLAPFSQNTTIGGCFTLLAGPANLAFDDSGYLFVVNNAGTLAFDLSCAPRYVTVYAPGAVGDQFPTTLIGNCGATCAESPTVDALNQPIGDAVDFDDNLYVTDMGDNSIKIFDPFANFDINNFFFDGELLGTISGKHTKLKTPKGIAIDADNSALYVVSNGNNSLEMFTDFPTSGGDIPPTLVIAGPGAKMNLPVGVALPAFTPTPQPTCTVSGVHADGACE